VSPLDAVDALQTLLGAAMRVIDELRREGLFEKLINLLGTMLPEDRETVITVLEHDAESRTQLKAENLWSRFVLRPNPFAQLFTRNSTGSSARGVRYLESRRASVVGARLARSLPPWGEGGWEPETIRVWRNLRADERAYVVAMSRRVLATLDQNRRRTLHV
jgi:hypothetical protein